MRALSVLQPWAWAIAKGHKPIENRDWPVPRAHVGARIAIHASKKPVGKEDREDFEDMLVHFDICPPEWSTLPYGAVVAVATVKGYVDAAGAKTLPRDELRWFNGPFGWLLADVVELAAPVLARGSLGLWVMTSEVETAVLHQYANAAARDSTRLGRELAKLEAQDPAVAKAARELDEVTADILRRKP